MTTPEQEMNDLESQVDAIIKSHQHLALENSSLHKKTADLTQELADLTNKHQQATDLLRRIIAKLKDELACQTQ